MIRFKCIYCGQRILAQDDGAGKKGWCPTCKHEVHVPRPPKKRQPITMEEREKIAKAELVLMNAAADLSEGAAELIKEKAGWLIPTYDKLSLFLMAVTWILLSIMNNKLNETIQNLARNRLLTIYVLTIPIIFLIMGIYQIFIKREESDLEKTMMLWFAIVTNVLTGIVAAAYIIKNADVRNWQIIFPAWNLANAVILYLMLVTDVIDENCIIDREVKPVQIIFGIAATVIIIWVCNYVLKLYWAVTFSICIIYTTSFDRALQSVFPNLSPQSDELTS